MTNSTLHSILGRTLVISFAMAALSVASFAQSQYAAVYVKGSTTHVGHIGIYSTYLQADWSSPGLKTVVGQPCVTHSDGTHTCTTYSYRNGQLEYKGEYKDFIGGLDFGMRNTERWNVNHWEREYNDGWTFYYIK